MKRSIFLEEPNTPPPTIQDASSEQFFSLKRKTKRMKVSLCFSEPPLHHESISPATQEVLSQSVSIQ